MDNVLLLSVGTIDYNFYIVLALFIIIVVYELVPEIYKKYKKK